MTETDAFPMREVFDPAETYKMDHKRRGIALIFNHERFFWHLTLPDRQGTCADRDSLKRRFSDLGFEVKCFDDLKAEELLLKIHEASTASHADADCFLCVFLSHGEGNHIYAYDAKIEIQTLTGLFKGDKCQSLVGKPKIFIIQWRRTESHIHREHEALGRTGSKGGDFPPCLVGMSGKPARCASHPFGYSGSSDKRAECQPNPGGRSLSLYTSCWSRLPHVLLCGRRLLFSSGNCEWLMVHSRSVRDAGKIRLLLRVHRTPHIGEQESFSAPSGHLQRPKCNWKEAGSLLCLDAN
nr:caspase-6 isoform X2 [Kogia breviceps]